MNLAIQTTSTYKGLLYHQTSMAHQLILGLASQFLVLPDNKTFYVSFRMYDNCEFLL